MHRHVAGAETQNTCLDLFGEWVLGRSNSARKLVQHCRRVAEVECSALITGETGTGKDVYADLIHRSGPRASKPFLPVNCGALPANLAESQLFGYEKGAFTGAAGSSLGIFRAAEGGIVFLDEIGELPIDLQPKLLRVLQKHEVRAIGAFRPVPIDVQVIAATNRDLETEVAAGRFREDLYYRLNLVQLQVPPLRDRAEDIPLFIEYFSTKFAKRYGRPVWRPEPDLLHRFCLARWPGNVRQLSHIIERSYVLDCAPSLPDDHEPVSHDIDRPLAEPVANPRRICDHSPLMERTRAAIAPPPSALPVLNLARLRNEAVRQALDVTHGHKGRAAVLLGIHPNTLTRLLAAMNKPGDDLPLTP